MTTHHIDIRVVPDAEAGTAQMLAALYGRLHLMLVQQRTSSIGISFPGYSIRPRALGDVLRLHGSEGALSDFMRTDWLGGMREHVRLGGIAPAPPDAPHRTIRRRQFKTSAERLRRRRMRRKGETEQQAAHAIPDTVERRPDLPYMHVRSRSNGQLFCMFIAMGPLANEGTPGHFNSYGLSDGATVPWF
ncbi:MAG TPA: type I-F CRISPR-associated endoribonuclease Cas6/Csy4 [Lysobacter sp.]